MRHDGESFALRLALSHREKARALSDQCERALAERAITEQHHETLHRLYSEQLALAETSVARMREEQRARLTKLSRKLRDAQVQQAHLIHSATTGEIPPEKANDINRLLTKEAKQLDARIRDCRRLMAAETSDELGGFVDLPLEEYARGGPGRTALSKRVHRAATAMCACVAICALFGPWVKTGGDSHSLWTLVTSTGGQTPSFGGSGSQLPLAFYILAPLTAIPLTALRHGRKAGAASVVLGAFLMASATVPPLIVSVDGGHASTASFLLSRLGWGAWVYALSGACVVAFGALRYAPVVTRVGASARAALTLSLILLGVLTLGILAVTMVPKTPSVEFTATLTEDEAPALEVAFTNHGPGQAALFVPARTHEAGITSPAHRGATFDVELRVREEGETVFKPFPARPGLWAVQTVGAEGGAFMAAPGRTVRASLETSLLVSTVRAQAVRVACMRADGERIGEYEFQLPRMRASAQ